MEGGAVVGSGGDFVGSGGDFVAGFFLAVLGFFPRGGAALNRAMPSPRFKNVCFLG